MDYGNIAILNGLVDKMSWLNQRQKVLAENIANADTPGYRSRDLKPFAFGEVLARQNAMTVQQTDAGHLQGGGSRDRAFRQDADRDRQVNEVTLDENSVSIEEQLMRVDETTGDYQLMTNLYRKQTGMFKTAIGRGR